MYINTNSIQQIQLFLFFVIFVFWCFLCVFFRLIILGIPYGFQLKMIIKKIH